MNPQKIPHMGVVVIASGIAVLGYAFFSSWVVGWFDDPALRGDILGTWKSFAVLAFGFWLGSSSGGKMREEKGKDDPQAVTVTNDQANPVPTTTEESKP